LVTKITLVNFDWKAGVSPANIINFLANEDLARSDSSSSRSRDAKMSESTQRILSIGLLPLLYLILLFQMQKEH
jgi:hypothetical protein